MKSSEETAYLGASVTQHIDPRHENQKENLCYNGHTQKVDLFGIKTHCSKKWKLLVFNAVITSKVLYGLETLDPTEAAGRLLSTFQLFPTKGFAKNSKTTHHVRAAQQFQ